MSVRTTTAQLQSDIRRVRRAAALATRGTRDLNTAMQHLDGLYLSGGQAAVPAMALGATAAIVVTLNRTMPNDTFSAVAQLAGGAGILGSLTIVGVTGQTATTVTVTVRAGALISSGATVSVIALGVP